MCCSLSAGKTDVQPTMSARKSWMSEAHVLQPSDYLIFRASSHYFPLTSPSQQILICGLRVTLPSRLYRSRSPLPNPDKRRSPAPPDNPARTLSRRAEVDTSLALS